jgi:hypothetical protein
VRHHDKGFGFFRYMVKSNDELLEDRQPDPLTPYANIFIHDSNLRTTWTTSACPTRNLVFEFQISEGTVTRQAAARSNGCIKALT